ncbi:signal peptidase II [Streptomyces niveus]|uniref:signal peptidase II n=1 Tax=Streptomyces niveus TaxID=193462 RepID=UPI0033E26B95
MNSNDEPDAAKTLPAKDTPGVRGPAATRGGSPGAAGATGVGDTSTSADADVHAARPDANDGTAAVADHAVASETAGATGAGSVSGATGPDRLDETAAPAGPAATANAPAPADVDGVAGTGAPDAADIGVDHAIATSGKGSATNAPEAPAPAARTANTSHAVGAGADTAASAAPVGTAVVNGADPVDADSAGAGTAGPDVADVGVDPVGAATATPDPAGTAVPGRRLFWSTLGVALVLLLVDQASKWWAVGALGDSESIDVVGDVIRFWLVYNPGAAFSMGTGVTWVFTIFAGVAVVAIAWYAWRVRSTPWAYALGLLLGGATSHFGDRLFREPGFARGHVVDFIDYAGFFVGNVADIGIFAGAVTIVVLSFRGIEAVDRDPVDNSAD